MRERKLAVLISTSLLLLPAVALSAGLGALTVRSAPGEPLRADIQLEKVAPSELGALQAQMAPQDVFRRANVPWDPVLEQLTLSIGNDAQGQPVLHVTSPAPIDRPGIDLLIQLSGPDGTVVREYPIALKPVSANAQPPVVQPPAASSVPSPVAVPSPAAAAAPAAVSAARSSSQMKPAQAPASSAAASPTVPPSPRILAVRAGDTLSGLAEQVRPEGVTLDQMLAALYEANRRAFISNNMNRLMAGRILRVPDATAIRRIDPRTALGMVRHQEVAWQRYRQALAGAAPMTARRSGEARSATSGGITTAAPTPAPRAPRDVLRLSRGDQTRAGAGGDPLSSKNRSARVAALQEELTARKEALQEADSRVAELEKNVKEMQQLLALKDRDMARLQQQAAQTKMAPVAGAVPAAVKPAPMDGKSAAAKPAAAKPAVAKPAAAKPAAAKPAAAKPSAGQPGRWVWSVVGGVVAGLFALGLWLWRRRRLAPGEAAAGLDPDFQETLEAVRRRDETPPAAPLDPVAAARQLLDRDEVEAAEELLTEALNRERHRTDVMLMLMEIYVMRGNAAAFLALARQYQAMHPGQSGPLWSQIAAMGRTVDPDNPLYHEAAAAPVAAAPISLDEIPSFTSTPAVTPEAAPSGIPAEQSVEAAVAAPVEALAAAPAPPSDADTIVDLDFGFQVDGDAAAPVETAAAETAAAETAAAELPAETVAAELPAETAAAELPAETAGEELPAELPPLDFSGIDLNLDGMPAEAQASPVDDRAQTEAATKLDLARAYIEMGDALGARQVLAEVLREGNPEQVREAQALLTQHSA